MKRSAKLSEIDERIELARIMDEQYQNPRLGLRRKGTPFQDKVRREIEEWDAARRLKGGGK